MNVLAKYLLKGFLWILGIFIFISMSETIEGFLLACIIASLLFFYKKIILPAQEKKEEKERKALQEFKEQQIKIAEYNKFYNGIVSSTFLKSSIEIIQSFCQFQSNTELDILKGDYYLYIVIPEPPLPLSNACIYMDIYNSDYRLRDLSNGQAGLYMLNRKTNYFQKILLEKRDINERIQINSLDMEQFLLDYGVPEMLTSRLTIETLERDKFRFKTRIFPDVTIYENYTTLSFHQRIEILNEIFQQAFPAQNIHILVIPKIF